MAADQGLESGGDEAGGRITLGVLTAIEEDSAVSQRRMARRLGIALGLTNAYLKRCVRKGLVKMSQAPANRYLYYLTPKGFSEKSRLTAEYLTWSFQFYRMARVELDGLLEHCAARGWPRIALCGAGELAEIAVLCAMRHAVQIVGIVDEDSGTAEALGLPLAPEVAALGPVDAVIVTDLKDSQARFEALIRGLPADRVLTPNFLNVSRDGMPSGEGGG